MANYYSQRIACGRANCSTCGGSAHVHGPYWYARWIDARGKIRNRYIGKKLPLACQQDRTGAYGAPPPVKSARRPPTEPRKPVAKGGSRRAVGKRGSARR